MRLFRSFAAAALVVAFAAPVGATGNDAAERSEARRQFDVGTKAFESRRFREAALAFEQAAVYRAHGVALYTAGLAWDQAGEPARAADAYARALDTSDLADREATAARARLDALEKTLGTIVVLGPADTAASVDQHAPVHLPARLHALPGPRAVMLESADGRVDTPGVMLVAGEVTTYDATPKAAPDQPATPAPVEPTVAAAPAGDAPRAEGPAKGGGWLTRRTGGYVLLGAGALAAGGAVYFGERGLAARDDYNAVPTREAYDHAHGLQTATNVAWISAAVLAGAGTALVLWKSPADASSASASVRVAPLPGGVAFAGAF